MPNLSNRAAWVKPYVPTDRERVVIQFTYYKELINSFMSKYSLTIICSIAIIIFSFYLYNIYLERKSVEKYVELVEHGQEVPVVEPMSIRKTQWDT